MANGEFNHNLSDFIVVMRGLISKEKSQEIIDLYKDTNFWKWGVTDGGVQLDFRKVKQISLSSDLVKSEGQKYQDMDDELFEVMSKAKNLYLRTLQEGRGIKHLPNPSSDEGYELLHYSEGHYLKEHADDAGGLSRLLTCTLNLNEGYDGGLFRLLRGEFNLSLGAGDAIMFPSNFMFPHEVTKITSGERYSIVTWFH